MMEEALTARLLAAPPLTDLVADFVNWVDRPGELEEDGPGALTLQMISAGRDYHFQGAIALHRPRIQFDAWALDYLTAKRIHRAALATMEPPADVLGVRFGPSFELSARDATETSTAGQRVFRISFDFYVWWNSL